jgi:hypothetical protein
LLLSGRELGIKTSILARWQREVDAQGKQALVAQDVARF